jgi:hypothetical protein
MIREFGIRDENGYRAWPETQEYTGIAYGNTPLVRARVPYDPALVTGLTWISRFRTKTVAMGAQMLAWGKLTPYWQTRCPCCLLRWQEDAAHIFLECSRWQPHRQKYLSSMFRQIALLTPPEEFTRTDRLALLLGGSPQDLSLPDWLPPCTNPYASDAELDNDSSLELSSYDDSSCSSDHSIVVGLRLEGTPVPQSQQI